MTTYLGKSCSFCLPRVPFVNRRQFMYLVISLLVLRAGYGIWLYQFLIIAYLFTLQHILWRSKHTSHFVVFITNSIHYDKGFWLFWGSFEVILVKISQNFIKSHLKICLISQISVHSLWHVCRSKVKWVQNKYITIQYIISNQLLIQIIL